MIYRPENEDVRASSSLQQGGTGPKQPQQSLSGLMHGSIATVRLIKCGVTCTKNGDSRNGGINRSLKRSALRVLSRCPLAHWFCHAAFVCSCIALALSRCTHIHLSSLTHVVLILTTLCDSGADALPVRAGGCAALSLRHSTAFFPWLSAPLWPRLSHAVFPQGTFHVPEQGMEPSVICPASSRPLALCFVPTTDSAKLRADLVPMPNSVAIYRCSSRALLVHHPSQTRSLPRRVSQFQHPKMCKDDSQGRRAVTGPFGPRCS